MVVRSIIYGFEHVIGGMHNFGVAGASVVETTGASPLIGRYKLSLERDTMDTTSFSILPRPSSKGLTYVSLQETHRSEGCRVRRGKDGPQVCCNLQPNGGGVPGWAVSMNSYL